MAVYRDPSAVPASRLLLPGRNCWRIERAPRFSMLVDGAAFFQAVRSAILAARHSIFILSWDIDSRMHLVPDGAGDGYPEALGDFLHAVVDERPGLHVHVLNWDFSMLYALEREWMAALKLGWKTQRRLKFQMDDRHPLGASHHQKVIVIDDALAFVGGLDLTGARWDTPAHAAVDARRRAPDGKLYAPFHDVQAMVDGDAARALGELVRQRWQRATGRQAAPPCSEACAPWPAAVAVDVSEVEVGIARTEPAFEGERGVHEIRQLHLDAIAAARQHMFFENQYFTSGLVADAFARRLDAPEGPEIVVVSPLIQSGWLEDATMGVLRARLHRRLQMADRHARYCLYAPLLPELEGSCLNVHSKLFSIDDELLSIGSANLSSRSMATDTECNLVLEARGEPRIAAAIAAMRARLLAEHLDLEPAQVGAEMAQRGSLIGTIEALRKPGRTLGDLDPAPASELDALIPDQTMFDPERPIAPEQLAAQLLPRQARLPMSRRLLGLAVGAGLLAAIVLAWRWPPLRDSINLPTLIALAHEIKDMPFSPLLIMLAYVLAGLVLVPVTLLNAVTGVVFGPFLGFLYAMAGSTLSAAVSYAIGAWLGRDAVRRLLGPRVNRLSRRIARRGILAVLVIRMVPVAHFTVVNVIAGASHIRLRDFLLGTMLGMAPGILLTVAFVHNLAEMLRNPTPGAVAILLLVVALLAGFALLLQRWLAPRADVEAP